MAKTMVDPQQEKNLRGWLSTESIVEGIRDALAGTIDENQFLSQMLIAFQRPDIQPCTEQSKFEAVHTCASYGLLPHLKQVALIPRENRGKGLCCDVMVQWQGLKALMERHPAVSEVLCFLVHKRDQFQFMATENIVVHEYDPFDVDRAFDKDLTNLRGGYLKIIFNDARGIRYHFLNREEILKRKRCAQTTKVWDAWPKEQAMKTIYRDGYARHAVPIDPLCQDRIERAIAGEDTLLGNDPSRVYGQPDVARIPNEPSRSRTSQAMERMRDMTTVSTAEPDQEAEPAEPKKSKQKSKTEPAAETTKTTDAPPDVPKELSEYAKSIHGCSDANSVARCWQVMVKDGGISMEAFDSGTDLRDWKLRKLGQDPDAFMEGWLEKESKSNAKSGQGSLLD